MYRVNLRRQSRRTRHRGQQLAEQRTPSPSLWSLDEMLQAEVTTHNVYNAQLITLTVTRPRDTGINSKADDLHPHPQLWYQSSSSTETTALSLCDYADQLQFIPHPDRCIGAWGHVDAIPSCLHAANTSASSKVMSMSFKSHPFNYFLAARGLPFIASQHPRRNRTTYFWSVK